MAAQSKTSTQVSWDTGVMGFRRDGWARQYKAEGLPAGQTMIASGEVH